jgi:alpha-L-rhamnosidase
MARLRIRPNYSFRKSILRFVFFLASGLLTTGQGFTQSVENSLLTNQWQAFWIAVPDESSTGYGVYLFRKKIDLNNKPDSFVIHVSADNRYKLFVNEQQVSLGPGRGDLDHWNFTTLDIAPFLHSGKNIIAAQVWNEGEWRAEGQISLRTAFILQGDDHNEIKIITDSSWKCTRDPSYRPIRFNIPTYYVAGAGELLDMNQYLSGWRKLDFSDGNWKNAQLIMPGIPKNLMGGYGTVSGWLLIPSVIPPMELTNQRFSKLTVSPSVQIPIQFPAVKTSFEIPAHSDATIILDQGFLTNAYPEIIFSGGAEGTISLSYAEALFSKYPSKGNRNVTEGKEFIGRKDSIISNGSKEQEFTPLSFRTYRYLQIKIKTQSASLVIEDVFGTFTGYPFQLNAKLVTDNPELNKIFEIGWRTARLCAMETYMDCPYYEQLQYIGDARIQALISLYNSGDERLLRNAMNQMDESRRPEGVTLSRHPSYTPQYIPTFSFWYIGMLHDYMMYGRDSNFIKVKLAGERQILQYFRRYQQLDGSLKGVPYWMFTDWVETKGWNSGVGPFGKDGNSALLDLQLLWAYQLAADLESKYGLPAYVSLYKQYAGQLIKTIHEKYWSTDRNLFADRSEKDFYSQHANSLAILTGVIDGQKASVLGHQILTDSALAPASIYFKFYLHQALVKAGLGNDYLSWLNQWRDNINMGMTTWAEISDINNARSDCHAWGASPNIEFFRTVLGIDSEAPGFEKIKIEPRLGQLKNISGEIPHPRGKIFAGYQLENGKWKIQIRLPIQTSGHLIWNHHDYPLKGGTNDFTL